MILGYDQLFTTAFVLLTLVHKGHVAVVVWFKQNPLVARVGYVLVIGQAEYTLEGFVSKEGHNDPYVGVSQLVQGKVRKRGGGDKTEICYSHYFVLGQYEGVVVDQHVGIVQYGCASPLVVAK